MFAPKPYARTNSLVHVQSDTDSAHGYVCSIDGGPPVLMCNNHVINTTKEEFELKIVYYQSKSSENRTNLSPLTEINQTKYTLLSSIVRFRRYMSFGDIALLTFITKAGKPMSPMVSPAKLYSFTHSEIKVEAVLLGCTMCGVEHDVTLQQVGETTYNCNTTKGHCGRPLVHFDPITRQTFLFGIHRFGAVKPGAPNGYEPYNIGLQPLDLYSDYQPQPCVIPQDDFLTQHESVTHMYNLKGQPSIIKTNFLYDQMAKLIPDAWVDQTLYELKEMSASATMDGMFKYNKHENWNIREVAYFAICIKIFAHCWAPMLENFFIPEAYEDFLHVMQFGGQDAKKHSSPGYPFNKDEYDKIPWLDKYGRDLFEAILNREVMKYPVLATNSPKDEVRAKAKSQRMFAAMPIHHTGVGAFLFSGMMMRIKEHRMDPNCIFSYGLSLDEMAVKFDQIFSGTNLGHSWDVDGCDTSIPASALELFFSFIRSFIPDEYHDLLDWYATNVIYTFLKNPDNGVWMKDMGNPSGHYITTLINAMWSSFILIVSYVGCMMKLDNEETKHFEHNPVQYFRSHIVPAVMGDDTIEGFRRAPYFTKSEIRENIPKNISITFDDPHADISNKTTVTFLSLKVTTNVMKRYRHVKTPMVHAKPDRMMVKMLYKHVSHDSTIFYQKVCNALCYMLFDSVWHERLYALKRSCERWYSDHGISYVRISLHDLECIRGIMLEELKPTLFQQGGSLNDISHFKSMYGDSYDDDRDISEADVQLSIRPPTDIPFGITFSKNRSRSLWKQARKGNIPFKWWNEHGKRRHKRKKSNIQAKLKGGNLNEFSHFKTMEPGQFVQSQFGANRSKKRKSKNMAPNYNNNNNNKKKKKARNQLVKAGSNKPQRMSLKQKEQNMIAIERSVNNRMRNLRLTDSSDRMPDPVAKAFRNIFHMEEGVKNAPSPILTGSKSWVCAGTEGFNQVMNNWKVGADYFKNLLIQTGHPLCPVLKTFANAPGVLTNFAFAYNANDNVTQQAFLEIYDEQPWGLWGNAFEGSYKAVLSEYGGITDYPFNGGNGHIWTFWLPGAAVADDEGYITLSGPLDSEYNAYVDISSTGSGAFTMYSSAQGFISIPTTPGVAGKFLRIALSLDGKSNTKFRVGLFTTYTSGGYDRNISFVPTDATLPTGKVDWIYNLSAYVESNYNYIRDRTSESRKVASKLIYTPTGPVLYRGGSIIEALLFSNDSIKNSSYESYLYTLPNTYLQDFLQGGTTMWFASQGDFLAKAPNAYPFNTLACPNISTNMQIITNVSAASTNNALNVIVSLQEIHDYTTSDSTLNPQQVISYNDDWARLMSICAQEYRFTCNPDHKAAFKRIENMVKFMFGGDPRAVAARKVLKQLGGVGLSALAGGMALA